MYLIICYIFKQLSIGSAHFILQELFNPELIDLSFNNN